MTLETVQQMADALGVQPYMLFNPDEKQSPVWPAAGADADAYASERLAMELPEAEAFVVARIAATRLGHSVNLLDPLTRRVEQLIDPAEASPTARPRGGVKAPDTLAMEFPVSDVFVIARRIARQFGRVVELINPVSRRVEQRVSPPSVTKSGG